MSSTKQTQALRASPMIAQPAVARSHGGFGHPQVFGTPIAAEAAKLPRIQTLDAWIKATAVSGERRDQALQKLDNKVADYLRHPHDPHKLQALRAAGENYEAHCRAPSVRSQLVADMLHAISVHAAYRDEVRRQARAEGPTHSSM